MVKAKGVKVPLGDFIGSSPSGVGGSDILLPNAPRQRDPEDDGRFRRSDYRRDNDGGGYGGDNSRSEQDGAWRARGSNNTAPTKSSDRDYNNSGSRFGSNRGGGFDSDATATRGVVPDRAPSAAAAAERPRLNLTKRTVPSSDAVHTTTPPITTVAASCDNPTKNASAVESITAKVATSTLSSATAVDRQPSPSPQNEPNTTSSKISEEAASTEMQSATNTSSHATTEDPPHGAEQPSTVNPRAAALMEAKSKSDDRGGRPQRGSFQKEDQQWSAATPLVQQNSRFSAAAASDPDYVGRGERAKKDSSRYTRTHQDDQNPPPVQNSRFAAAADRDYASSGSGFRSSSRSKDEQSTPPPEVQNSRFAAAAAADRDYVSGGSGFRSSSRGKEEQTPPPEVQNSRFAAAAAADRDYVGGGSGFRSSSRGKEEQTPPPEVQNSRFAAAAAADRDYVGGGSGFRSSSRGKEEQTPPPEVQNSRFAAAAAADRDYVGGGSGFRSSSRGKEEQATPPPVQNSRFAAAAAADRDYVGGGSGFHSSSRGKDEHQPPLETNSRFAAAVRGDSEYRERGERGGADRGFRSSSHSKDEHQPPLETNSRFAAAVRGDSEYRERGERGDFERGPRGSDGDSRGQSENYRREERRSGNRPAYAENGQDSQQQSRSSFDPHQRRSAGDRYSSNIRDGNGSELPRFPSSSRQDDGSISAADFPPLKSTVVNVDLPKPPPPPPVSAPIALPGETEEAARARIEKKKKEAEEKKAAEAAELKRKQEELMEAQKKAADAAEKARAVEIELLEKFSTGAAGYGNSLKKWCAEQGTLLPSVEKLVFALLMEQEKTKNPDVECPWAASEKFGAAVLSLVEDNIRNQIGVLVGIQFYCEKIGFPKLGEEAVVQAMFRAMYKYDLTEADAFFEWKEDESTEYECGKLRAITQTVDWFNWLEEDEEDDDGDEEDDDGDDEEY